MMPMVKGCFRKACDAMPFGSSSDKAEKGDSMLRDVLASHPVAVFGKTSCPYCSEAKAIIRDMGAEYYAVELDQTGDGSAIIRALKRRTHQRTVPNIFISGKHVGGCSELQRMKKADLQKMLEEAGAL